MAAGAAAVALRPPSDNGGGDCVCKHLGGDAAAHLDIDSSFAVSIADTYDRNLVVNIAATAQALLVGTADASEFRAETTDEHINVVVRFPPGTCFDVEQLLTIKFLNEDRIRKIWVQPEADCVFLCTSVWRADVQRPSTVLDVVLVRRRIDATGVDTVGAKRRRTGSLPRGARV